MSAMMSSMMGEVAFLFVARVGVGWYRPALACACYDERRVPSLADGRADGLSHELSHDFAYQATAPPVA